MKLGRNERAIQARLNIIAGLAVMRNPINLVMQEALLHMNNDEAENFVDRALREAGIECFEGVFYLPTGIWSER